MLATTLAITKPEEEHDRELIADYQALYKGGKAFRARIKNFLLPNEREPLSTYDLRCREAAYRGYSGPIVDYFAAFLMASGFTPRAKDKAGETVEPDSFYADFNANADGNGADLDAFMRDRAADALTARCAWWVVELPPNGGNVPADRAEYDARGLGRATVRSIDPVDVLDWECDDSGELEWVTTYTCSRAARDPHAPQPKTRHEWRIYDRENIEVYAAEISAGENLPTEIPLISSTPHRFPRVPVIRFDVGDAFWVLNRIASAQLEHFRLSAGLGWSIRRTCYATPVFNVEADEKGEFRIPTMGAGYGIIMGANEKMGWAAPPTSHFEVLREEIKAQKDEIYRMIHQMAVGVENNAASVGRSGESKLADAEAIKVILTSLGALARCVIEKTFQLISDARKDPHTWAVEGLDVYDDIDAAPLAEAVAMAMPLDIPSPTFEREVKTRVALALVAGAEQATKDKIREEIANNIGDGHKEPDGDEADGDEGAGEGDTPKPKTPPGGETQLAAAGI